MQIFETEIQYALAKCQYSQKNHYSKRSCYDFLATNAAQPALGHNQVKTPTTVSTFPNGEPVPVLAIVHLIQLPVFTSGKQQMVAQVLEFLPPV